MDGVTILSEISCRGTDLFAVIVSYSMVIFAAMYCMSGIVETWRYFHRFVNYVFVCGALLFIGGILFVSVGLTCRYKTFHTEYTVMVNDTVGFNEFYNHYDIISQDGDIYRVKEVND